MPRTDPRRFSLHLPPIYQLPARSPSERVVVGRDRRDTLTANVGVDAVRDLLVRVPDDLRPQLPGHPLLIESGRREVPKLVHVKLLLEPGLLERWEPLSPSPTRSAKA